MIVILKYKVKSVDPYVIIQQQKSDLEKKVQGYTVLNEQNNLFLYTL